MFITRKIRSRVFTAFTLGCVSHGLMGCQDVALEDTGSLAQAVTFPVANADWVAVEQLGVGLTDPDTDAQNNGRNIVGTTLYPAVYIAASDTHFMVRMRTNDNPVSGQNLAQYGWGILFEIDGNTASYDYLLLANASGANDVLTFYANTTKTGGFSDDAETLIHSEAIVTTVGGNVRVSLADSSLFSGQDYFLDIGIPLSVLTGQGIELSTPLRVIIGTSSNGTRLSEDIGGTSSVPANATLSSVLSDVTFLDGKPGDVDGDGIINPADIDNDNDGIPDTSENTLGVDPDADQDNDGIPNWKDKTNTGAGGTSSCTDAGADGVCDVLDAAFDADGDGTPDHNDVDSDNDGIIDFIEAGHGAADVDGNGLTDEAVGSNGLANSLETSVDSGTCNYVLVDTDGDGTRDVRDLDSDGDGVRDVVEAGLGTLDANNNGRIDSSVDVDDDGLMDPVTADANPNLFGYPAASLPDVDNDDIPDAYDFDDGGPTAGDSDGDTIPDDVECASGRPCPDSNLDGIPNYMVVTVDSDGDGVDNSTDLNPSNPNVCVDTDLDLCDDCTFTGANQSGGDVNNDGPDGDADGLCDAGDPDHDNDGVNDVDDVADLDPDSCRDLDSDSCDDCSLTGADLSGGNPAVDGADFDSDGICDVSDDTDGDGVTDALDSDRTNPGVCRDVDADGCDDCAVVQINGGSTSNDGADVDNDGTCDLTDDSDGDGVVDATDTDVNSSSACRDVDADGCDDCSVVHTGGGSTSNDGADFDNDGICDLTDDSDGDGVADAVDVDATDSNVCRDVDADSCDDCSVVQTTGGSTSNDGPDADNDGICDATDDSDGDGVTDANDLDRDDASICRDQEGDSCDDCSVVQTGGGSTSNDGPDADEDGICDLTDDSDGDGVPDAIDTNRLDPTICRDADDDDCDDCTFVQTAGGNTSNDGADTDSDGICDLTDDSDGDGVSDALDADADDSSVCSDADNDGCDDCAVVHTGGGSVSNDGADADEDGICDVSDDSDGDGVTDATDLDIDDPNVCRDLDFDTCDDCAVVNTGGGSTTNDGPDADEDGICDAGEGADLDGDGTPDSEDADTDGDGVTDADEGLVDEDGDGLPNHRDLDSDGDGLHDTLEAGLSTLDADRDGRLDDASDADGDGLPTSVDADDGDANTTNSSMPAPNSDGTGLPDFRDNDSDDDGILDSIEGHDHDADGVADVTPAGVDSDDDGLDDAYALWLEENIDGELPDSDGDELPDYRDDDDDDDGEPTVTECENPDASCPNGDGDAHPDYLDAVNDVPEVGPSTTELPEVDSGAPPPEAGTATAEPPSTEVVTTEVVTTEVVTTEVVTTEVVTTEVVFTSSEDPSSPSTEALTSGAIGSSSNDVVTLPVTTSEETSFDSADLGSTGAATTGAEHGTSSSEPVIVPPQSRDEVDAAVPLDAGEPTSDASTGAPTCDDPEDPACPDSDGDGILDLIECPVEAKRDCPDTDGDGKPDYLDSDDDGDGIPTKVELERGDTDRDGIEDYLDSDDDNDGKPTKDERSSTDLDRDGIPDYLDPDKAAFAGGAGCSVDGTNAPGGGGWLGALLVGSVFTVWRRRRRITAKCAVAASLCAGVGSHSSSARAQTETSPFQLNRYRAAPAANDGFAANRAIGLGAGNWSTSLQLDYSKDALVIEAPVGSSDNERYSVIEAELAGTLNAAVGLGDAWTGFVAVPFVLVLDGERVPGLPEGDGASLGDPEVGARVSLAGNKPRGAHLAAQLGVQFPVASALSERQSFVGSDGFTFSPQLIGDVVTDSLIWSLSVGARLVIEKARLLELDVGHEATAVLGAALPICDSLSAHAEVFGSTFVDDAFSRSGTAIEGLAGLRVMPMQGFRLGAAVGSGFTRGVGAPDVRAVFSATLFSENRPAAVPPPPSAPQDSDLDGFIDVMDRCPSAAEDLDGFEDADGCPESDNDADGILDAADGCPLVAEDKDGFEDNDGCAETDNDGDGIADADDNCPTVAGKVELAGCPIVDADLDGVADAEDSCPNEPGTPELKGCKSKPLVQISGAKIELVERVYFETNKDVILPQSFTLLENVASVIKSHPEITTILVEGHTDDKGADDKNLALSQKRAEAVMQFLINHGVEKTRLQAKGFGEQVPIADNQTSEGRATNRRVEFRILSAVK